MVIIGLTEIRVGTAAANGTMPGSLTKIGKVYKGTCRIEQDAPEVTEHFEENKSAPEVRKKDKKIPKIRFSLMDFDAQALADYVGGTNTSGTWGYDGSEVVANKSIKLVAEQGLDFEIPNADIEAVLNGEMTSKGILLIDFIVTPTAVSAGKPFRGVPKA